MKFAPLLLAPLLAAAALSACSGQSGSGNDSAPAAPVAATAQPAGTHLDDDTRRAVLQTGAILGKLGHRVVAARIAGEGGQHDAGRGVAQIALTDRQPDL